MSSFWSRFRSAPVELQSFTLFCALVVLVEWGSLLFAPRIHDSLTPRLGWSFGMGYAFALIMAAMLVAHRQRHFRRGILVLLAITLLYGLAGLAGGRFYVGDVPLLQASLWRPVWALGIPLVWMALLSTRRLRRWSE